MGDEVKGLDEQIHGDGGIQTEGFIRHDAYIWQMLGEVIGYQGNEGIGSHQDGHL